MAALNRLTPRLRRRLTALAALLAGAVVPLAFAPFDIYLVAPLALAVLFVLWHRQSPRQAFASGWLFGVGMFGAGVYWVFISVYEFGHAPLAAALVVVVLLVAYLALYPALLGYGAARWASGMPVWRFLAVLPAGWMILAWVRGWLMTGFPWLDLGYSQIDAPLGGLAPVLGVYGVSWATALTAGGVALAVLCPGRRRWVGLAAPAALWAVAAALGPVQWTTPRGTPLTASLVQGNIPQELKWEPSRQVATLEKYLDLTRGHWGSDVVVWPETAIPAFYSQVRDSYIPRLKTLARRHDAELLTGVPVLDRRRERYYNAVVSIGRSHGFYFKQHLVPFGEYLPLRDLLGRLLEFMPVPMSDFSAGGPDQPLLKAHGYPVGVSVCYEVAFTGLIRRDLPAAAFLVNVSNDGWFGHSLAPHQHLEMARMRARETGRFLLRATNTGISAIIGPRGRILSRAPQFQAAVLSGRIVPLGGATPYVRLGTGPVVAAACLVALAGLWRGRRSGGPGSGQGGG
ncbi:MAG TPA: apolipoprotein N-acyltransferase [Gammaproteobacteria bacterium]|nr:apolipoprotein N-acyltransferase [Gammaproteobacteria bacterium]